MARRATSSASAARPATYACDASCSAVSLSNGVYSSSSRCACAGRVSSPSTSSSTLSSSARDRRRATLVSAPNGSPGTLVEPPWRPDVPAPDIPGLPPPEPVRPVAPLPALAAPSLPLPPPPGAPAPMPLPPLLGVGDPASSNVPSALQPSTIVPSTTPAARIRRERALSCIDAHHSDDERAPEYRYFTYTSAVCAPNRTRRFVNTDFENLESRLETSFLDTGFRFERRARGLSGRLGIFEIGARGETASAVGADSRFAVAQRARTSPVSGTTGAASAGSSVATAASASAARRRVSSR